MVLWAMSVSHMPTHMHVSHLDKTWKPSIGEGDYITDDHIDRTKKEDDHRNPANRIQERGHHTIGTTMAFVEPLRP